MCNEWRQFREAHARGNILAVHLLFEISGVFFRGVPGFLGGVPGFLGVFLVFLGVFRVFWGCSGFFGCSGMFRDVPVFRCSVFRCSWKYYMPINDSGCWQNTIRMIYEFFKYSSNVSLQTTETCGLLLLYNNSEHAQFFHGFTSTINHS